MYDYRWIVDILLRKQYKFISATITLACNITHFLLFAEVSWGSV